MTNEQNSKLFDQWYDENYDEWAEGEEGIALREELEHAFKDGLNIGFAYGVKAKVNTTTISDAPLEQVWHDLRKNPEDTPPLGVIVMVYDYINRYYRMTVGAEKEWYKGRQLAWRYLPEPPEE